MCWAGLTPTPTTVGRPVNVLLECTQCQARHTYPVPRATVTDLSDPIAQAHSLPEGWDGYYLGAVITCASCGAVDQYTVTEEVQATILDALDVPQRQLAPALQREGPTVSSIQGAMYGIPTLWDSTRVQATRCAT